MVLTFFTLHTDTDDAIPDISRGGPCERNKVLLRCCQCESAKHLTPISVFTWPPNKTYPVRDRDRVRVRLTRPPEKTSPACEVLSVI